MERCYFGKNIKFIRRMMGCTQEEFGKLFNKTKTAVSYWESEVFSPNLKEIFGMADIFGVTVNELLCSDLSERKDGWKVYNPNDLYDDKKLVEITKKMSEEDKAILLSTLQYFMEMKEKK